MERVRRSPHIVAYWRRGALILHNYATGVRTPANPSICPVLHACAGWTTAQDLSSALGLKPALVSRVIRQLVSRSLLQQSGRKEDPRERAMRAFAPWNPEAGFFHTATKDVRFWSPQQTAKAVRKRARESPM